MRITGQRLGCSSRLRMASLKPRYHFRAAPEFSALIRLYSCARSRSAREVMLTRYAMGRVELIEKLPCRPEFSFFRVLKALTDSFLCIGAGGNVEQMLISFSVLNDGRGLPIHCKHHGALTFFQLFHEVTRPATEGRQRLDVFGDVKHQASPLDSTLLGAIRILHPPSKGRALRAGQFFGGEGRSFTESDLQQS